MWPGWRKVGRGVLEGWIVPCLQGTARGSLWPGLGAQGGEDEEPKSKTGRRSQVMQTLASCAKEHGLHPTGTGSHRQVRLSSRKMALATIKGRLQKRRRASVRKLLKDALSMNQGHGWGIPRSHEKILEGKTAGHALDWMRDLSTQRQQPGPTCCPTPTTRRPCKSAHSVRKVNCTPPLSLWSQHSKECDELQSSPVSPCDWHGPHWPSSFPEASKGYRKARYLHFGAGETAATLVGAGKDTSQTSSQSTRSPHSSASPVAEGVGCY